MQPFFRRLGISQALQDLGFFKLSAADVEFAPGIPSKERRVALPEVTKPQSWTLSVQEHEAEVAGKHFDLRLIDPATGHAHSWALPKAQLPTPGKSVLAVPQPTHTSDYATTFGKEKPERIESGYGKGVVSIKHLGPTEVYHSKPEEEGTRLRFNVYKSTGPEEYAIVRTSKGQDLLVNKTLSKERLPHLALGSKPKLKATDVSAIDLDNDTEVMMPKYDGAHNYLDLDKPGRIPRMFSYRTPKRHSAGVIEHTHKVDTVLTTRVPKELARTTLRVETVAVDKNTGRALPAKNLAGMLNATVENSRKAQQAQNATLLPIAFDVVRYKGKDVGHLPYRARYDLLQTIKSQINLPITEVALDPKSKAKLLTKIKGGKHPLTSEGVVLRPLDVTSQTSQATKAKFRPDHDVFVREIFPAVGKENKTLDRAGGFRYSWTPRGPVVGSVGTGFDHGTARDMLANPERYKGRVAKVEAETKYESGALGKASFREWHLEKGDVQKLT